MRASTAVASLVIVAAAAPAVALPVSTPFNKREENLEVRVSLGALGKELGKGVLTGGAFAGLAAGAEDLLGGDSSAAPAATPAAKRDLTVDDIKGLLAKRVSLGALGKELGKGVLTGGAFAGLAAGAEDLLGGDSSAAPAATPAPAKRGGIGEAVGKLLGATEAPLANVVKTGLTGGVAAGTAIGATDTVLGQKRELDTRQGKAGLVEDGAKIAADTLGDTIKKKVQFPSGCLTNGVGAALGGTALGAILGGGDDANATRRELETRQGKAGLVEDGAKIAADTLGDTIKKGLTNGVGAALGGTALGALLGGGDDAANATKRELDTRQGKAGLVEDGAKIAADTLGDTIKKGLTNGVGAALGGTALGAALGAGGDDANTKRELDDDEHEQLVRLLARHLQSREPQPLGAVGKGLIGTGVGLLGSGVAQEAIDGVKDLISREPSLNELD